MDNNIILDTHNLKDKLKKADQTGLIAWEIGQIADRVKKARSFVNIPGKDYVIFKDYTEAELGKSESSIDNYIKIW